MTTPSFRLVPLLLAGYFAATVPLQAAADYSSPYLFSTLAGTSNIGARMAPAPPPAFYARARRRSTRRGMPSSPTTATQPSAR